MLSEPGAGLGTVMAGEVIGDDEDVARGVVGFDIGEQGDVVRQVARGGTPGQFLAVAHAQRPIHPGFLRAATVIEWRFDAVPIGRPAGAGAKVRGTTGPSSSVQMVVDPSGGSV